MSLNPKELFEQSKKIISRHLYDIVEIIDRQRYRPNIIPPKSKRRGSGIQDYLSGGKIQFDRLIELAGMTPDHHILDIGCGDGRLANAMIDYLKTGSYSTIEVQERFVNFLARKYRNKHPQFIFTHANLWHSYYNPTGKYQTTDYRFPYENNSFDLVHLNSIFSHFLPDEISHYLDEINRVLRPGGTVLMTCFLANQEALSLDEQGLAATDLRKEKPHLLNYRFENYWTRDNDVTEKIVALDEGWFRNQCAASQFEIGMIVWGDWCGRAGQDSKGGQDTIIARKREV